MRNRILTAAAAVALLFPGRPAAQVSVPRRPRPEATHVIVDRLLAHREELSLTKEQVVDLSALSSKLRRGRLKLVGLDRVPGKSAPRYKRVYLTSADARRMAIHLLTPPQAKRAEAILGTQWVPQ
jgi:hypothetical protein